MAEHKKMAEHKEAVTADIPCSIKRLPDRLLRKAAEAAKAINPANAPVSSEMMTGQWLGILNPEFLTVMTSKYFGVAPRRFSVSFMENQPGDLKARILTHMNAWGIGITFYLTTGIGQIRISTGPGGYYSYLGTDVLLIPSNRQTMNLQGFSMQTPESEFRRVVRHEVGHTMGFPHEHMRLALVNRIDPQKAYDYFLRTQGWSRTVVDQQVLTPLSENSIMGTLADQTSIMCYQLPASITKDGLPITGGTDINPTDFAFAKKLYPPSAPPPDCARKPDDWDESEDVGETELRDRVQELFLEI